MTTKREALKALHELANWHPSPCSSIDVLYSFIDAIPNDPFVLPPPGTEFTVRIKGVPRTFYHARNGNVLHVQGDGDSRCSGYSLEWFVHNGAEIVEETT